MPVGCMRAFYLSPGLAGLPHENASSAQVCRRYTQAVHAAPSTVCITVGRSFQRLLANTLSKETHV